MGEYDKILKENIEQMLGVICKQLLHLDIQNMETVTEKFQTTVEREPDFLKKVVLKSGKKFILHLEFQRKDEKDMVYRMAEYKAIVQRKLKLPVQQYLIFLGNKPPKMPTQLPIDQQITGFEIYQLNQLPVNHLLASDVPEELLLAVLADFPKADAEQVIRSIIAKLKLTAPDDAAFKKSLQQLVTLSRMRNLQQLTELSIKAMPITYEVEKDYLYKKGRQEGKEEGRQEGKLQGKLEGKLEGRLEGKRASQLKTAEKLLASTSLTPKQIANATDLSVADVEELKKQL